jgi:hypothetical protein
VRRHAKASTAGSTQRQAGGPGRTTLGLVCLVALSLAGLAFSAVPALAATATDRVPLLSFDGADTTAGPFSEVRGIAVDNSSGSVYVLNAGAGGVVDKLNANGEATNFSATGKSSLDGNATPQGTLGITEGGGIAVDGSGVNPGRIYVPGHSGQLNAFSPAGEYLWQFAPGTFANPCGVAVDTAGHLWVADRNAVKVREFAATGSPPAEIASFTPQGGPCGLALDAVGDVYLMQFNSSGRFDAVKYVGGVFSSALDPDNGSNPIGGVTVDQSSASGHIFVVHSESFNEYESNGTLIGTMGANTLSEANGIGYSPALDHVYVAQFHNGVKVFGPKVTGTVPDPTIEATSEAGVSKAKFHGKVNPQSVPNEYFFEWKVGTEGGWGSAKVDSSTPQSLPEDSSEHAVEFATSKLRGNTTYQVRLVAENTTNGLRSWSGVDTFTTAKAAAAPTVTIDTPSPIGTTTATVSGTINPQGDTAGWRVQLSSDPACATGFTDQPEQSLPEGSEAPVNVSYNLASLLPSRHYCVRIRANNSFGSTISEAKQIETAPVIADEVEIAPAAPRLDASARLNARVNPHGDKLKYRFEYSKDGGAGWVPLGVEEDTGEAREQIVIGSELSGLSPSTSYRYRLALLEDSAGPASSLGAEETFTTRTTAEATPPDLGIELVNNPDKGTQNAFANGPVSRTSPISPDGDKALWTVSAGAPGSNSGTFATFLAERSADGWHSHSLVPSAGKQLGGGGLTYQLETASPDFAHFVSTVAKNDVGLQLPQTIVRLDANASQDILTTYTQNGISGSGLNADMSADGTHVVAISSDTQQLEDIGSGTPELISVLPDDTPASCPVNAFTGQEGFITAASANWRPGYHRIAQGDGSRVYFQVAPNGQCSKPEGLYERNRDSEETTLIDSGADGQSPELIRSTPDGRQAYFVTKSKLDSADTNPDRDVYRWDEGAEASTCLTCAVSADAKVDATTSNQVVVSDDFSHVYFSSREQLVPGRGRNGRPNIYAMSGGQLRFITDAEDIGFEGVLVGLTKSLLSTDGNVLTFKAAARESLSADDVGQCLNLKAEPQVIGGCTELYRYDDRDGSIECLSCLKGGLTTSNIETPFQAVLPVEFQASADGGTVAFTTQQRLLPRDVNNDTDIYEWRNGSLRLITDGLSDFQEGFAAPEVTGIDAGGKNVLFSVVEPGLTGYEHDGLANVYDARIGGGFERPVSPVHCEGDSCQGLLQAPPGVQPQSSAAFSGHGNAKEEQAKPRCRKSKVRRKGRCIARHPHKRRRQRAGHANQGRTK